MKAISALLAPGRGGQPNQRSQQLLTRRWPLLAGQAFPAPLALPGRCRHMSATTATVAARLTLPARPPRRQQRRTYLGSCDPPVWWRFA
jgi:hypothetical protein